jgi:hypothetical protein
VHDQAQAAQAGLALDAGDHVVRQLDPFDGRAEHELAGMDHERGVVVDLDVLGHPRRRLGQVDRRQAVVVEDAKGRAELQIDARGLDHRRIPRLDLDPFLLDQTADRAVRENRADHVHILAATMD